MMDIHSPKLNSIPKEQITKLKIFILNVHTEKRKIY